MEKESQPESIATVTIKPEYPASEIYASSEPPPAYHRPVSASVQVAKIIAVTVVLVSVVLGGFILASAYVTANASCKQLEQELALLSEAADRFQGPLQPEALIQEKAQAEASEKKELKDVDNNIDNSDNSDSSNGDSDSEEDGTPIHFKLPLQLDFDDLAGALIDKNQKSRMNCIVEKKRAEEMVDHQPKTINLPFGLNLTTDPRFERISGERMAIFCESGNMQRNAQPKEEDDQEEETIMIQPVMIPIPSSQFQTHMSQQMPPMMPQHIRQPMPPQQPQIQIHVQSTGHLPFRQPIPQQQSVHPMETMRPPMPPQPQPQTAAHPHMQPLPQFPPNQVLHQIAQQIIADKIMEAQKEREEQESQASRINSIAEDKSMVFPDEMAAQKLMLPEEVLTQLNRLPNRDVIVAVSEADSEEDAPEMRVGVVQQQRDNAHDMNGRQAYARGIPLRVPVQMMQQETEVDQVPEERRAHFVQPRSVRSVDAVFSKNQKRVKRCACDCSC